ncbi:hypothetical protein PHLCEN_2v8959 [Hermanssonia centrifuga]|uniref:Pterin-binding domain-containing protein n=1 Tax=Hermanssonia centrifuga TaxID=98765 RepID=A0A2R6NSA6_9APHY|nr:hypothetical protein PHLCEN_2v8959 [Hermanssonia centrifuga]
MSSLQRSTSNLGQDVIRVRNLLLTISFTDGAQWPTSPPKSKLQPTYITLTITHSIARAALTDDLALSINYSTICATITEVSRSKSFGSSEDLADHIVGQCFELFPEVQQFTVLVTRPKALLQPAFTEYTCTRERGRESFSDILSIRGLECYPIVGINACEREQEQLVRFDVTVHRTCSNSKRGVFFPYRELSLRILKGVNSTSYLTLEALVSFVADIALCNVGNIDFVNVCGGKPDALSCVEAAEVEITRTASNLSKSAESAISTIRSTPLQTDKSSGLSKPGHTAAIALGSNLGDRFVNIEYALRLLELPGKQYTNANEDPYVYITDTSFLYETEPMYVTDQPKFINCACLIETNIFPTWLLKFLKEIETDVGRVVSFRNGPRAIDLDLLTYDAQIIDTRDIGERDNLDNLEGHLLVPHPRIAEREFVLRPLNDITPDYIHPVLSRPVSELLDNLMAAQLPDTPVMNKVIPFPQYPTSPISNEEPPVKSGVGRVPNTATYWSYPSSCLLPGNKTYIMGTLNATPDSFSDGSVNNTLPAAINYASSSVAAGADIIDIGGYSTRPGAAYVSPDEEIARVVPVIKAIRAVSETSAEQVLLEQTSHALISVDTFRWEVAEAAVLAGANCINDVYAFTGPTYPVDTSGEEHLRKMRQVARDLAVPVILMHSRGEASANKDYSKYSYATDVAGRGAVLEGVRVELGQKVNSIVKGKGGLRRWMIIVDPGIGFSKTVEGNLEILQHSAAVVADTRGSVNRRNQLAGYAILIGASRKSFLGAILARADDRGTYTGRETKPNERDGATAAAVACAVRQGATVVRVHDVMGMGDVVRITSALLSS